MKPIKILLVLLISLSVAISVCGAAQTAARHNIAIVQHQQFIPFKQAHDAFVNGLKILGAHGNYSITDDFNANSDIGALESKIKEISNRSDIDLVFTIGTHSTKRMISAEKNKPIVFTIVGDPEHAGILNNWKSSGANFTGVETPDYYSKVVRLMHNFVPFKSLGMIYLKGSPSHEAGIHQIRKLSEELGFKFVAQGFPLRNENRIPFPRDQIRNKMHAALEAVCPQVEAFFVQTSNTFTSEFDLFADEFIKYRIVSAGDPTNIRKGLVMGIGKDANRFGRQCAQYALRILAGVSPASLPMDVGVKLTIDVNLEAARKISFDPPFELISGADNLYQDLMTIDMPPASE